MSSGADVDALVTAIFENLVDHPDDVEVSRREDGRNVAFEVTVNGEDVGKVIGRQGRVIKAIRVVTRAAGLLDGKQVFVDVVG